MNGLARLPSSVPIPQAQNTAPAKPGLDESVVEAAIDAMMVPPRAPPMTGETLASAKRCRRLKSLPSSSLKN